MEMVHMDMVDMDIVDMDMVDMDMNMVDMDMVFFFGSCRGNIFIHQKYTTEVSGIRHSSLAVIQDLT